MSAHVQCLLALPLLLLLLLLQISLRLLLLLQSMHICCCCCQALTLLRLPPARCPEVSRAHVTPAQRAVGVAAQHLQGKTNPSIAQHSITQAALRMPWSEHVLA
jgi:hypothetical protein